MKRQACEQGECHVKTEVMLPEAREASFSSTFRGSRPCQHLDLGFFNSRTVKQYISAVYITQFVAPRYSSPSKLIHHRSPVSCILASTLTMPMKFFPPSNNLYSGHWAHPTCSFWPADHPSLNLSPSFVLLTFLNTPSHLISSTVIGSFLSVMKKNIVQ